MDEPRTHYQISLTARQAVGLFATLLVALGLAFFFGLKAGLAGRAPAAGEGEAVAVLAVRTETPEPMPRIETAVPTAVFSGTSRTVLAPRNSDGVPSADPTAPATLQPFLDGSSDETPPAAPTAAPAAAPRPAGPDRPAAGKYWVQVASLTSRDEAGSLQARLSRRGFHAQILTAAGPRGTGRVYRVRVGPYASEPDAQRVAVRLEKQEKLKGPWVVPEGP